MSVIRVYWKPSLNTTGSIQHCSTPSYTPQPHRWLFIICWRFAVLILNCHFLCTSVLFVQSYGFRWTLLPVTTVSWLLLKWLWLHGGPSVWVIIITVTMTVVVNTSSEFFICSSLLQWTLFGEDTLTDWQDWHCSCLFDDLLCDNKLSETRLCFCYSYVITAGWFTVRSVVGFQLAASQSSVSRRSVIYANLHT